MQLGIRPPLAEAAAAVVADRKARGLSLPSAGPDARQVGSVFLNPPVNAAQAERLRAAGSPVFSDGYGRLRGSAGWLLERCGYGPGQRLSPGVRCSTARTLTVTAGEQATAAAFWLTLTTMSQRVAESTGIALHPEPARLGT
ncbi:hypothetical protein [Streptomyces noursei]|uniref:hypothetical protein n=1 Tax=Streptomyces noursei TaxID=1971 RepID=UPI00382E0BCA